MEDAPVLTRRSRAVFTVSRRASPASTNGNLKFTTDFRSVYASVLQGYLHAPASELLGGNFETLPLLKS